MTSTRSATRGRLRIGVVTTSYPRFAGDHAGNFVAAHAGAMRELGHDVDVVGANVVASSLFDGTGAPEQLERGRGYLRGALFTARLAAAIAKRARDWDLVVAHWLLPALAALPALVAVAPRTPMLAIAHGGDVHTLRRLGLLGPALHLLRARGAKLAFVSDELRRIANAPDALVQPMGIDVDHFASLGRAPSARPLVLVVARLVPIKGVDIALAALAHLRHDVELVIAGDGPERPRLERIAAKLAHMEATTTTTSATAMSPRVRFVGAVDAATRDDLLRRASVVVVPSRVLPNGRTEGTPMIALEALAAGVPVIASAVGGLAALAQATRVRPDDPRALAAAIDRVLASPPRADDLRASVAALAWPHVAKTLLAHAGCEADDSNCRRSA